MSERIAEDKIQEIRERIDIVEVVSSYLPLKHSGENHLGLCPFHGEKTPSFNVNSRRQIFHCFGCGVGGNVFSFLMRMEGVSFPDAVRRLAERVGVEIEETALSPAEMRRREEAERMLRVNEVASLFYHQVLMEAPEGEPGRRYLKARGYGRTTSEQFRLGFAPRRGEALAEHLAAKGFDPQWAQRLGLVRVRDEGGSYDLFRQRLIFPILDARGATVAFGARVLDASLPKYINSPESPVYHKGRVLYGLHQGRDAMRQRGEAVVVEGYFDLLALQRAGFTNAAASCGTALTPEHARLLKRYAERVLLLFDQDSAGRKATFRAMDVLLAEGIPAAVVELEAGDDPDSFLRDRGEEAMRQRFAAARPVLDVFIESTLADGGEEIAGRARAVEMVLSKLRLLPGDIERSLYLKRLAERTGLAEPLLQQKLGAQGATPPLPVRRPEPEHRISPRSASPRQNLGEKNQDWLLALLLADAGVRKRVAEEGSANFFSDDERRGLAERLLAVLSDAETYDEARLFDRLSEAQKAILSGILMRDEKAFADETEAIFEGCRRAVASVRLKKRSQELQVLIDQAAKAGDSEWLGRLMAEKKEVNRKRDQPNVEDCLK
jgi:DNA primase